MVNKWNMNEDGIYFLKVGKYELAVLNEANRFFCVIYTNHSGKRKIFEKFKSPFGDLDQAKKFLQNKIKEIAFSELEEIIATIYFIENK